MHEFIRPAAVAGTFYPEDPQQLAGTIDQFLSHSRALSTMPKALIVPHAGYIYSGPIAASAYACLLANTESISRVVLIGPSHRVGFRGLALSQATAFSTPLGNIPIDVSANQSLSQLPFVDFLDDAHTREHSLEVQLPFLQRVLKAFTLLPIVAGEASAEQVTQVLEKVWGGAETLIVVSSDLSHYHDYETAQKLDNTTSHLIETLAYEQLDYDAACGRVPVSGLMNYARKHRLGIRAIDLRNSGDTAGDKHRVVGYGAYVVE